MSERNFIRVFREDTGQTPAEFVESSRIQVACRLLEEDALSVKEIAERCGLGSAATLRRIFTRRLSVSPMQYRDRFRGQISAAATVAG